MNTKKADMLFPVSENVLSSYTGEKLYEMTNHLGNVLTVINDIKVPYQSGADILYYATITNTSDYSPFGVTLDGGRTQYLSTGKRYRFAYQGSEQDDEVKGEENFYTTEFRLLDPRLGRWLSIDPLAAKFPWQSPYCSMDNNPVVFNDPLGDEVKPGDTKNKRTMKKQKRDIARRYKSDPVFREEYDKRHTGNMAHEANGDPIIYYIHYSPMDEHKNHDLNDWQGGEFKDKYVPNKNGVGGVTFVKYYYGKSDVPSPRTRTYEVTPIESNIKRFSVSASAARGGFESFTYKPFEMKWSDEPIKIEVATRGHDGVKVTLSRFEVYNHGDEIRLTIEVFPQFGNNMQDPHYGTYSSSYQFNHIAYYQKRYVQVKTVPILGIPRWRTAIEISESDYKDSFSKNILIWKLKKYLK